MATNWTRRGAKILASFVTGYSGGLSLTIPIFADFATGHFSIAIFTYPLLSGMIVSLPQLGKVLNEFGMGDM